MKKYERHCCGNKTLDDNIGANKMSLNDAKKSFKEGKPVK